MKKCILASCPFIRENRKKTSETVYRIFRKEISTQVLTWLTTSAILRVEQ